MYEDEVKTHFFDLLDDKLIKEQVNKYLAFDNTIKSIVRHYEERHSMDWKSMMRETLPTFLSPAILNKTWMI
jgi:hypothetical protein